MPYVPVFDLNGRRIACSSAFAQSVLAGSPNALGERPSASSCDLQELGIAADLIEHGKHALRFRKEPVVHIRLELAKGVIHAEAVVFDAAHQEGEVALLARESFEDLHEHGGRSVQSVIESGLMHF